MTSEMKIKALAPWFGGKRNLAPWIVEELGEHSVYWEPFCGSMSVLLAKPPCVMETVNDLHSDLCNLAMVIKDANEGPRFYRALRRTLMHEDVFARADALIRQMEKQTVTRDVSSLSVFRAYMYFIVSWLGRNGTAGTPSNHKGTYCVRYTSNGGHAAKRFTSAVESIPAWRRRMRNVTILNRDGFDLIERIEDAKGTAIYCDPPYLVKGAKYLHDFNREDHSRLADLLARFTKTRVVVSYYDHPALADLYPAGKWTRVSRVVNKSMTNSNTGGGDKTATEVLLINGPSFSKNTQPSENPLFAEGGK
jgi:DNA adenine methylase